MKFLSNCLLIIALGAALNPHFAKEKENSAVQEQKSGSWSWKSFFQSSEKDKSQKVKPVKKKGDQQLKPEPRPIKKALKPEQPVKKKGLPAKLTSKSGIQFQLIKPTKFQMGSEQNSRKESPRYQAEITKPFYMGTYEITQGQWKAIMGDNPSRFKECGAECPVESISWDEAQEFIKRINQKEGKEVFRLPTEAEWELAARAGSNGKYFFGDNKKDLKNYAWFDGNSVGGIAKVGQKKPNKWGLFDMHGNISEWVHDWYGTYQGNEELKDPQGASGGSRKVVKGGCWYDDPTNLTSAYRVGKSTTEKSGYLGFRLIRTTKDLLEKEKKVIGKK